MNPIEFFLNPGMKTTHWLSYIGVLCILCAVNSCGDDVIAPIDVPMEGTIIVTTLEDRIRTIDKHGVKPFDGSNFDNKDYVSEITHLRLHPRDKKHIGHWIKDRGGYTLSAPGIGEWITFTPTGLAWSPSEEQLFYSVGASIKEISAGESFAGTIKSYPGREFWGVDCSPDGREIVSCQSHSSSEYGKLAIVNVVSSEIIFRTGTSCRKEHAHVRWSPDGSQIAYDDGDFFYVIDRDGSNRRKLGEGIYPVWSPSGDQIAFYRINLASNSGIYLYTIEDGTEQVLFEHITVRNMDWR